jgi:Na+/melibiose symporter-like transporter
LLDKIISAFGNAIAAFMIAFIGYKTTTPQMGDPATWPLFWMSMFLSFGLPIIGFACTIVAMKWYHLSKEEMVNVANEVHEMRENAKLEA